MNTTPASPKFVCLTCEWLKRVDLPRVGEPGYRRSLDVDLLTRRHQQELCPDTQVPAA